MSLCVNWGIRQLHWTSLVTSDLTQSLRKGVYEVQDGWCAVVYPGRCSGCLRNAAMMPKSVFLASADCSIYSRMIVWSTKLYHHELYQLINKSKKKLVIEAMDQLWRLVL